MGKVGKFLGGAVVVGALGAAVFFRVNQEEAVMEAIPDPTVRVENPVKATVELQTGLTGTVTAEESVYVIATGSGEVLEVYAKLGDYVEKDQALFKIDNLQLDSAKIQLDAAKIQLQDAQTNLNRMQVLYESGDIAAQAYEQVKSGVEAAKLQVKGLQLAYDAQMDATVVKAPISEITDERICTDALLSDSLTASMSLVKRDMTSPCDERSKKRMGRVIRCA